MDKKYDMQNKCIRMCCNKKKKKSTLLLVVLYNSMPSSVRSWLESLQVTFRQLLPTFLFFRSPNFLLCHISQRCTKNRTNKERHSDCQSTWCHLVVFFPPPFPTPDTLKSTPQHTQNNNQTITTLTWLQERKSSSLQLSIHGTEKSIATSRPEILLFVFCFIRISLRCHIFIRVT